MSSATDNRKRQPARAQRHRLDKLRTQSLKPTAMEKARRSGREDMKQNAWVDCGWGRLFFAQTFENLQELVDALRRERPEKRDIAFYLRDPHVALSLAPQELFLDPSHTYRVDLHTYRPSSKKFRGFHIRRLSTQSDAEEVNRIYRSRNMVQVDPDFIRQSRDTRTLTYFVAEDNETGAILGTVTGVNHYRIFNDPERGSSLWCLAVDPQAPHPSVGEALVRQLTEHFQARSCAFMDLSVMHDNSSAIALYEKLGFVRVPYFALKTKSSINEKLFAGPSFQAELNIYAMIIINEALRRGIHVEVLDAEAGYFRLSHGGRSVICWESLSELTTAIAMARCDNKAVTRRLLGRAGLIVPSQKQAGSRKSNEEFLDQYRKIVVKPRRGEQGRGVYVGITDAEDMQKSIKTAGKYDSCVLLEQFVEGQDLRVIVIDFRVIAAAVRRPPRIVGDGNRTIRDLIKRQSRRRSAATDGESRIPIDAETTRCVEEAGYELDDVLPADKKLEVRKAANLHTGGTIHDVTDQLHPKIVDACVKAARAIDIPVVGLDLLVEDPSKPDYVFIEANERPGLANHEPQPTAERFVDLLFPLSVPREVKELTDFGQTE